MLHSSDIHFLMLQPISVEKNLVKERIFNKTHWRRQKEKKKKKAMKNKTHCLSVPEVNISVTKLMFLLAMSTQEE